MSDEANNPDWRRRSRQRGGFREGGRMPQLLPRRRQDGTGQGNRQRSHCTAGKRARRAAAGEDDAFRPADGSRRAVPRAWPAPDVRHGVGIRRRRRLARTTDGPIAGQRAGRHRAPVDRPPGAEVPESISGNLAGTPVDRPSCRSCFRIGRHGDPPYGRTRSSSGGVELTRRAVACRCLTGVPETPRYASTRRRSRPSQLHLLFESIAPGGVEVPRRRGNDVGRRGGKLQGQQQRDAARGSIGRHRHRVAARLQLPSPSCAG
ncbi:conserved hypothetical protein [Ricinus communis]|uniref:Uncharacterized protein n=1 Tax=Ricinus communis TaxID=3988 RepID=B9TKN1_RICCO|nr:conserved hypothetical protein [Ricinus communis]